MDPYNGVLTHLRRKVGLANGGVRWEARDKKIGKKLEPALCLLSMMSINASFSTENDAAQRVGTRSVKNAAVQFEFKRRVLKRIVW